MELNEQMINESVSDSLPVVEQTERQLVLCVVWSFYVCLAVGGVDPVGSR